jgi:hypothetical protein
MTQHLIKGLPVAASFVRAAVLYSPTKEIAAKLANVAKQLDCIAAEANFIHSKEKK